MFLNRPLGKRFIPYCASAVALLLSSSTGAVESDRPFHQYNELQSVARNWNEALLSSISRDYARPTVHARNLFHAGIAMYDAWAFFDSTAEPYLLGKTQKVGTGCPVTYDQRMQLQNLAVDKEAARNEAMSYAMYRFIYNRFRILDAERVVQESPGYAEIFTGIRALMANMGYDATFSSADLSTGSAAALGNYLASCIQNYGRADGANERQAYANTGYQPTNPSFNPATPGVSGLLDPNRWQPLELDISVDQAGNLTSTPPFLGANWGLVDPFALDRHVMTEYDREHVRYPVYFDPGPPPSTYLSNDEYKWNHLKVVLWSAHLDNQDQVKVDISPAATGNTAPLPDSLAEYRDFYPDDGIVPQTGHEVNPSTGQPYESQIVLRGDYTRVLAEFWADGPDSLTPPGHWFRILNEAVLDHPDFKPQLEGVGPLVSDQEWSVKAYFTLGAAMHDAAIAAWSAKGWYDSSRPITAIRYMSSMGQASDPELPNYHPDGVLLKPGYIELVEPGDPLAGANGENIGKVKLYTWRGPDYIEYDSEDIVARNAINHAGVGWILGENWWPYQRPTFVSPPFAGYLSGHSTFSRAAAEVLTLLTGDPYFPGGMAEFVAKKDEFLVFEKGPSSDVRLQWATYRDASDQTSLSRIWGGIHPPVDDIPGRKIGIEVGHRGFAKAKTYFNGEADNFVACDSCTVDLPSSNAGGSIDIKLILLIVTLFSLRMSTVCQLRAFRAFGRYFEASKGKSVSAGLFNITDSTEQIVGHHLKKSRCRLFSDNKKIS